MAGYSKIYCIGREGGFMGSDGLNSMWLQIWVGDGGRQWLEARYFDKSIRPIGKIRKIIPPEPDSIDFLIDACIAFFPRYFKDCPTFATVEEYLKDIDTMDFHFNEGIPAEWQQLREEAKKGYRDLAIYEAPLIPIDTSKQE